MAMEESFEALVHWVRTFPDFPGEADPTNNDGAKAVAKVVEELCDVPIFSTLSAEELENTDVLYEFLKAVTEKANTSNRSFREDSPSFFIVLVNLLDCAVRAKNKEKRKIYISRMMGLPGKSQSIIMRLIEQARSGNQSSTKLVPSSNNSPQRSGHSRQSSHRQSPPNTSTAIQNAMTPSRRPRASDQGSHYYSPPPGRTSIGDSPSIGFLSPGTRESPQRLRSIVSRQNREIDELKKKIQDATGREKDYEERLDRQEQSHRKAMMSMETQSLSKLDDVQSTLGKHVEELQEKVHSLSSEAQKGSVAIRELAALKDELAIYEGNDRKLEEANKKIEALKSKLHEFSDAKSALLKEEEAHGRAIDKIVNLENEIGHLQPFKRQVQNYKQRAVEAEVRLVECQDCVSRLEKRANEENAQLFKDMMMQKSHLTELRQRILDETKPPSTEIHNGIGEGLSELNPQVKEELARLRNENVRLRAFQTQRSDDAVQRLEESLENAEQLAEQFKSNYLSTKETLRRTKDLLKSSEEREKAMETNVQDLQNKVHEYEDMVGCLEKQCSSIGEELSTARNDFSKEQLLNNKLQESVSDLHKRNLELDEERMAFHQRLQETSAMLDKTNQKLNDIQVTAKNLNETNEKLKDDLLIKQNELDVNENTIKDTSSQLAALHNELVDKGAEIERLKKELLDLQKRNQEMALELGRERSDRNNDAEEARKVLESTKSILEQRLVTETKALQENMNSLLEDERKDNRKKQKQAQELISSQESKWKAESKRLKEQLDQIRHRYTAEEKKLRVSMESEIVKLKSHSKTMSEDYEKKIDALESAGRERESQHRDEMKSLKEECEKKKDDIVRKGKELLNDAKANARDALIKLRSEYNEVVEDYNSLNDKIIVTANELEVARNEIDEKHREVEKHKDRVAALEHELTKFQEENEHFRRQLSGRQYIDNHDAQSRLEKMTKELSILHEEHRKLKRSVRKKQFITIGEDEQSRPYDQSNIATDDHAIQRITTEYEKKLSDLQEEKRELIMKNSAQITDITRTEMKVHECEKAIQVLKSENTSLKLKMQRADLSYELNENELPVSSFSPSRMSHSSPSKIPRSSPSKLPRRTSPSIDRAKRQKATSEEFLRSRITGLKGQSPSKVLSTLQSKTHSPSPKSFAHTPSPTSLKSSGLKVPSPSKIASEVHRLNGPDTPLPSPGKAGTITEAMIKNSSSPRADDPGECKQS